METHDVLWKDFDQRVQASSRNEIVEEPWSCGNRQDIQAGDRVFLLRQGPDLPGIIGSGWVTEGSQRGGHWDPVRSRQGQKAWFVGVDWDALLAPENRLPREVLLAGLVNLNLVNAQAGGVLINPEQASSMEKAWRRHVKKVLSKATSLAAPAAVGTEYKAKGVDGDSLYQQRARRALPILVRQAKAGQKIYYSDLAEELGMPNARNLNYVLGSIGRTLNELGQELSKEIPPIQSIAVNRGSGFPGEGFYGYLARGQTRKQKEVLVKAALAQVFAYPEWNLVLSHLGLKPLESSPGLVEAARRFGSGGESKQHLALKNYVADHPSCIGLSRRLSRGRTEFALPSGDCVDVLFLSEREWVAVEVKSIISSSDDVARGLFQCVKYLAVIDAWRGYEGDGRDRRALLVLEGELPRKLIPLRNTLGVKVIENVRTTRSRYGCATLP